MQKGEERKMKKSNDEARIIQPTVLTPEACKERRKRYNDNMERFLFERKEKYKGDNKFGEKIIKKE